MTDKQVAKALAGLDAAIADSKTAAPIWSALEVLAKAAVGAKLFTVMQVDFERDVAARVHTRYPQCMGALRNSLVKSAATYTPGPGESGGLS